MDGDNSGESPLISIWGDYTGVYSVCAKQLTLYSVYLVIGVELFGVCFVFASSDSQEGPVPPVGDAKMPWSDEETRNLLDIWGKDSVQRALKGCLKNRHIFTQIAQKMAERGYMRTVEQCQTRIKRLKKCFRQKKR